MIVTRHAYKTKIASEMMVASREFAAERRAFLLTEACGGHGRNGYDAWQQSGTRGLLFNGMPWHWDESIPANRARLV